LVPVAICLVGRLTYFGNTLTVVCVPALREDLAISQLGITSLRQAAVMERS